MKFVDGDRKAGANVRAYPAKGGNNQRWRYVSVLVRGEQENCF